MGGRKMTDTLKGLYEVIQDRQKNPQEGSYTCYLFEKGIDKILKKCAEECGEVIIAAKNGKNEDTTEEIWDLINHGTFQLSTKAIITHNHDKKGRFIPPFFSRPKGKILENSLLL